MGDFTFTAGDSVTAMGSPILTLKVERENSLLNPELKGGWEGETDFFSNRWRRLIKYAFFVHWNDSSGVEMTFDCPLQLMSKMTGG